MKDAVSPLEARDIVARRMVESARRNGHEVSHEEATRRVGQAMQKGDQQRANGNR